MNIVVYPNAKINIGLRIIEKRQDGFHNLETLFVPFYGLRDILEIVEANKLSIHHYGVKYSLPGNSPFEDICIKAYNLIRNDFDIPPVEIHLCKQIPVGAGLGGGSADAAFTLKAIDSLFSLNISQERLLQYAASLGSDCPFFIYNKPMFGEGKGDILSDFESPVLEGLLEKNAKYKIELRTSSVFVKTSEAYSGIVPSSDGKGLSKLLLKPIEEWKGVILNDFESGVFAKYPALRDEKEKLYREGAIFALMSGSGSSIYGIFSLN